MCDYRLPPAVGGACPARKTGDTAKTMDTPEVHMFSDRSLLTPHGSGRCLPTPVPRTQRPTAFKIGSDANVVEADMEACLASHFGHVRHRLDELLLEHEHTIGQLLRGTFCGVQAAVSDRRGTHGDCAPSHWVASPDPAHADFSDLELGDGTAGTIVIGSRLGLPEKIREGDVEPRARTTPAQAPPLSTTASGANGSPILREPAHAHCEVSPEGNPGVDSSSTWSHRMRLKRSKSSFDLDLGTFLASSSDSNDRVPTVEQNGFLQKWISKYVEVGSRRFEHFFAAVIILNAVCMGVELEWSARGAPRFATDCLEVSHYFFSGLFFVELALRVATFGWRLFTHQDTAKWAWFDLGLVLCSVAEVVFGVMNVAGGTAPDWRSIQAARMIRTSRIMRAFRIPRLIRMINSLRTLVYTIAGTLRSLVWALALLFLIMYVFGIVLAQATADYFDGGSIAPCHGGREEEHALCVFYGSLSASIFTLFKSITGGISWHEVVVPLEQLGSLAVSCFVAYIAFTYFAVLNVVTGVFCNSAIETAQRDPELAVHTQIMQKHRCVKYIKKLFNKIDDNESGSISLMEFEEVLKDENVEAYFAVLDMNVTDALEMFKLIDTNHSKCVDIDEFVEGCLRLRGSARAIDVERLYVEHKISMHKLRTTMRNLERRMRTIDDPLGTQSASTRLDSPTQA